MSTDFGLQVCGTLTLSRANNNAFLLQSGVWVTLAGLDTVLLLTECGRIHTIHAT